MDAPSEPLRILGLDPGLRATGWGVIEADGPRLRHVANGVVRPEGGDLARRLLALHDGLRAAALPHRPTHAAAEQTFVNRDAAGTLKLGQARGVVLLVAAGMGLPVGEYAPNAVKKTVVGVGLAAKEQVEHMVRMQLPGASIQGPDAADALAVAICHAFHLQAAGRLGAALAAAEGR